MLIVCFSTDALAYRLLQRYSRTECLHAYTTSSLSTAVYFYHLVRLSLISTLSEFGSTEIKLEMGRSTTDLELDTDLRWN